MKALDIYLAFCFFMVFGALLEWVLLFAYCHVYKNNCLSSFEISPRYATVSYTAKRINLHRRRFTEFKKKVKILHWDLSEPFWSPGWGPSHRSCQTKGEERPSGEDWGRTYLGRTLRLLSAEDGTTEEDVPSFSPAGPRPCASFTSKRSNTVSRRGGNPPQQSENANTILDPSSRCWRTSNNSVWSSGKVKSPKSVKSNIIVWCQLIMGVDKIEQLYLFSFGFKMRHFYFVVSYKTYWVDSSTFPSVAATSSGIRESHSPWLSSPSTSCTGQFWSASQKFKLKTWCPSRLSNINCESIDQIEDFLNIYTRCPILRGPDENWWWPCARTHHILNWTISSQFHSVMLQGLLLGDIFNHKSILCQHFGVLTPPKLWFKDKQWVNCSIWKANSA